MGNARDPAFTKTADTLIFEQQPQKLNSRTPSGKVFILTAPVDWSARYFCNCARGDVVPSSTR